MVLTKFVEGAREVEMDAVGKEGRVSTLSSSLPSLSSHQIFLFLAVLKHNRLEFMISAKQVSNNNGQAAQSKKNFTVTDNSVDVARVSYFLCFVLLELLFDDIQN